MKRTLLFMVLFLISVSLVAAVEVSTSKNEYGSGETVAVTISDCQGTSIVKFLNPGGMLADIKSGQGNWQTSYSTLSDSADGKYSVTASCSNGAAQDNFCVDAPGCLGSAPAEENETGGGGQEECISKWDCSVWSFCGPDKLQKRSCTDRNHCKSNKQETRPCAACQESWVCSLWSECRAGTQSRACYDEHFCETETYQPALQKGCAVMIPPGPEPDRISFQLPPPFTGTTQAPKKESFANLWESYGNVIIGILIAVVLAVLVILGWYHFKPKKVAYNINELKEWIRKEKQMGTSDGDVREILKHNTGWTDEEIDIGFESLRKPQVTGVTQKANPSRS